MAIDIHESRKLKQARPNGQDVDLLRIERLLLPHLPHYTINSRKCQENSGIYNIFFVLYFYASVEVVFESKEINFS